MKKCIAPAVAIICAFLLWNQLFPLSIFNSKNKLALASQQSNETKNLVKRVLSKETNKRGNTTKQTIETRATPGSIQRNIENKISQNLNTFVSKNRNKTRASKVVKNKEISKHARTINKLTKETFTLYFDKNESIIKESEKAKLNSLIAKIKIGSINSISINGHSDSSEADVSLARARSISDEIRGISSNLEIHINNFGKKYLADRNSSFLAHANNRRAVIKAK